MNAKGVTISPEELFITEFLLNLIKKKKIRFIIILFYLKAL